MPIKAFIIFSLLTFSLSTSARTSLSDRSYIVTKTNDTLYGKIKVNFLIGGLRLITADTSYKIDPNAYTAYYNAKEKAVYRSKVLPGFIPAELAKKLSIPEQANWLKCIEDGKIKLYEYTTSTFGHPTDNVLGATTTIASIIASGGIPNSEFTNWYIEKEGLPITPIKYNSFSSASSKTRKERKALLKDLVSDNDRVSQNYTQTRPFSFKVVQAIIYEYNNSKS